MTAQNQDPINLSILAKRMAAYDERPGPRVGDFLSLTVPDDRCRDYTRFTHDWGDRLQTGGSEHGSYYLGGGLSYSGGLDPGISKADLVPTGLVREGSVWFFDRGISGAGRGVEFRAPFRVFTVRDGADIRGIDELRCPYHLSVLNEQSHLRTCGYWYVVTKRAMAETAFATEALLREWLAKNRLVLTAPLTPPGEASHQFLGWPSKEVAS